jgi:hypothetical protein
MLDPISLSVSVVALFLSIVAMFKIKEPIADKVASTSPYLSASAPVAKMSVHAKCATCLRVVARYTFDEQGLAVCANCKK